MEGWGDEWTTERKQEESKKEIERGGQVSRNTKEEGEKEKPENGRKSEQRESDKKWQKIK